MFEKNLDAAKSLELFLKSHGFDARTYDDKVLRYFLFLRPPQKTYRVQVEKSHQRYALKLLEAEPPAVLSRAMHCPTCGSLRVEYPQMTRRFILPTIVLHLGIIFRVIGHQCYCHNCHEMWTLSDDVHVPRRTFRWFPF